MKMLQLPISLNKLNHEFRTPLTAILGIAELLNTEKFTPDQKLYLQDLQNSAYSLLVLADKLSSLAQEINVKQPIQNDASFLSSISSTQQFSVLLVEDSFILQAVHKKMLDNLGYRVELANSAEQALNKINTNTYDLVLMDINLPGMSGIDAAAEIRRQETREKHLPIIALTGLTDPKTRQACLDAGINVVASKPITQEKLHTLVASTITGSV
jgi:CheY-like chemotaxis protein